MPLSRIEYAEFIESQRVFDVEIASKRLLIPNDDFNDADFIYESDSSQNNDINRINLKLQVRGLLGELDSVVYNGFFAINLTDWQIKVNGATSNANMAIANVIKNAISVTQSLNVNERINDIVFDINRNSILNAQANNRRLNIRSFELDCTISESSAIPMDVNRVLPSLQFFLSDQLVGLTKISVTGNSTTKNLTLKYSVRINTQPLVIRRRTETVDDFLIDLSYIQSQKKLTMSRTLNLINKYIFMQINTADLDTFLSPIVEKKTFSAVPSVSGAIPPYLAEKRNPGSQQHIASASSSFREIENTPGYNRDINQYTRYGFILYNHNTVANVNTDYQDSSETIRCAYSVAVGLKNSRDDNNPAALFAILPFDTPSMTLLFTENEVSLSYVIFTTNRSPNNSEYSRSDLVFKWTVRNPVYANQALEWRFSDISLSWIAGTNNYRLSINNYVYQRNTDQRAPGSYNLEYIIEQLTDDTTLEELRWKLSAAGLRLDDNRSEIASRYYHLKANNIFLKNANNRYQFNLTIYPTDRDIFRLDASSPALIDYIENFPTNPNRDVNKPILSNLHSELHPWNDETTLGDLIDAIAADNLAKIIRQYVPLRDFWLEGVRYSPKNVSNSWRNLKCKKLFYNGQDRAIQLFGTGFREPTNVPLLNNCFVNIDENSSRGRTAPSNTPIVISKETSDTLETICTKLQDAFEIHLSGDSERFSNLTGLRFTVANSLFDLSANFLYISPIETVSTVLNESFNGLVAIPTYEQYSALDKYIINSNTTDPNITQIDTLILSNVSNLNGFISEIQRTAPWRNLLEVELQNSGPATISYLGTVDFDNLQDFTVSNLTQYSDAICNFPYEYVRNLTLSTFETLELLQNSIATSTENNITCLIYDPVNRHPSQLPINLTNFSETNLLNGAILSTSWVERNVAQPVTYDFNLKFNLTDGAITEEDDYPAETVFGLQVALGGYEKNGIFYPNDAPNAFFEPSVNTIFPIEFLVPDAEIAYLLLRTRITITVDDVRYSGSTRSNCFAAQISYDNENGPSNIKSFASTNSKYTDVWTENFGMPSILAVPLKAYQNSISITDNCRSQSVSLKVLNIPSGFTAVGFLALNKNNTVSTQKESKLALAFGLVLDAIGAWDVLISPNSILTESQSGTINYDGRLYTRSVNGSDEAYTMEFNDLPAIYTSMVSLSPLPNNPKIWTLKISPQLKQLLISQSDLNNTNSLNGCFATVDIKITGRFSNISSLVRVKIYRDYNCVYDKGICDSYWNLVDPPKLTAQATQSVENRINLTVQELINCEEVVRQDNNNYLMNQNLLLTLDSVPTFPNGNALLFIKTSYEASLREIYLPNAVDLKSLRYKSCSIVGKNRILESLMNREFLLLPNNLEPIIDATEIQNLLRTESSYMYMRPLYQFPPEDEIKDCGENEAVLAAIGYVFKNWRYGFRTDNIVLGLRYSFSIGVYATPQIQICTRYYYSMSKT